MWLIPLGYMITRMNARTPLQSQDDFTGTIVYAVVTEKWEQEMT